MSKMKLAAACAALLLSGGVALAQTPAHTDGHGRMLERMCGDHGPRPDRAAMSDRLASKLALTDDQKAKFKDLEDARGKSRDDVRSAICNPKPDMSTFKGRLDLHQKFLEAQLAAVKAVRPKLDAFYDSLNDKQKAEFVEMRARWGHRRMERHWRHHHHHHHHHHDM